MEAIRRVNGSSASSSSVDLVQIPPDGILRSAPLAERLLAPALARDPTLTWEHLLGTTLRGEFQWWFVLERGEPLAVLVTEIVDEPGCAVARVLAAGGSRLERWRHVIGKLEGWASQNGARYIEVHGRRGWQRVLSGYEPVKTVLRKELA